MKKWVKVGLSLVLGMALVLPAADTSASAASKKHKPTTVISTTKVAKKAYHGTKGDIDTSAKLTKRKYQMKNYKYTTWYAYKKSVIKKNGKKATVTYIKAGKKSGWIYAKYLKAGKAPINKKKRFNDAYAAYSKAVMSASTDITRSARLADMETYEDLGSSISDLWTYGIFDIPNSVAKVNQDRKAILSVYKIFKGRFSKSQNASLNSMAVTLSKTKVTKSNRKAVAFQYEQFATSLGTLVENLN